MNPKPNAMPIMPMPRARSSGRVTSAMYALAVPRLAVAMPLAARAMKSQTTLCATMRPSPRNAMPTAVASTLHTSTGRRPTRSDTRPHTGTNKNCISE